MKVLITGGAGYIGTELVYKLIPKKNISSVIVYDNLSRRNFNLFLHRQLSSDKVHFIRGDILDTRKLKQALKKVDVVFHLAAKVTTPFANEDPHSFDQVNNWGTAELSYAVEQSEAKELIYVSSASVYGSSDRIADESTPPMPDTFYGISKFNGEKHVNRLAPGIKTFIIRCGNVYGFSPSMRFDAVINRFMFEANYYQRISVHGSGEQSRAFIPVDKASSVLSEIPASSLKAGTYNLVDKNLSIAEITGAVKAIFPRTEMLYINQNMPMRQQKVNPENALSAFFKIPSSSLKDELVAFKNTFAFS